MPSSARECNETDVRLVNGTVPTNGRVQICLDGLWGSVCDDRWDSRDAEVVCRQLQFDGRKIFFQFHPFITKRCSNFRIIPIKRLWGY